MQNSTENKLQIDQIQSIEEIQFDGYVYDLACDSPHLYLSNGFVSHNCVLWVDQVEKGISGMESSGKTDGGTTSRVMQTWLTWMQEKKAQVFIVGTANRHEGLPAQFMRRWDQTWFVDNPTVSGRQQILQIQLRKRNLPASEIDLNQIALATKDYNGDEIRKIVNQALISMIQNKQPKITTNDILKHTKDYVCLYVKKKAQIQNMREWASENCRHANKAQADTRQKSGLDL